jgi:hypothetical protein
MGAGSALSIVFLAASVIVLDAPFEKQDIAVESRKRRAIAERSATGLQGKSGRRSRSRNLLMRGDGIRL